MFLDKKLFFIFFSTSFYCFSSSPPSASQALQFIVDLGFQNSPAFQRVCVHRIPVFILNYIYARVVILGILRVVHWSLLFWKEHFKEIR
jgi:hypothetical protein